MGLREYRRKRDFSVTPEPPGDTEARGIGRGFVVQKHAASRLHYDFRLELEGVLKSWAVPKGPSLDPQDKRLAMQTEDHPLEYREFEGVIPEGEYGGGTVVVWDQGTWEPIEDPHQGFHKGSLKFRLHGRKLRGGFALVKIKGREARDDEKSWLLIKEKDEAARPGYDVAAAEPTSVLSGRTSEQVARDRDRVWHSDHEIVEQARTSVAAKSSTGAGRRRATEAGGPDLARVPGARRAALPDWVEPQLATLVAGAPSGEEWLHEIKIDGYRILARLERGRVSLLSRRGKDWTGRLPTVAQALGTLRDADRALLDGEAAVVQADGTTSFQALQNWMGGRGEGQLVYFAFDLLHWNGYDLTAATLERRKALLERLLADRGQEGVVRLSEHVAGSGPEFQAEACRLALEGVVSKRRDASYTSGRSRDWLKAKCTHEQEFVIGGYTRPRGERVGVGALLVGVYEPAGTLRYAGKVGTGFSNRTLRELERRLSAVEQKASPFAGRVEAAAQARWVRPELVAQVAFTEWTGDGKLRHPSFRGLREDKDAREVVREEAPTGPTVKSPKETRPGRSGVPRYGPGRPARRGEPAIEIAGVQLTHPDRVVYPEQGTTKRQLAEFYASIADWILPQLAGRPTTLVRCPEGVQDECFYQKHVGFGAPASLRRVKIREAKKVGEYLVVDDLPGLIGLVQLGILEIHTWNSVAEHLERPDRLVFDLDPDPSVSWQQVVAAAQRVRERLTELDLASFVKTTGGKGLHVVVPLQRGAGWDECGRFAEAVARGIAREQPERYVAEMSKSKRRGRVFIDYLRNHRGATSVAAYSTRARAPAPISTPLRWEELAALSRSDAYTVATLPTRLASLPVDPWAGYTRQRQRLTASRLKKAGAS